MHYSHRTLILLFVGCRLHMLRNIRDVFSVTFKIDSQPQANPELALGGEKLLLTCRGIGLNNYGKQML